MFWLKGKLRNRRAGRSHDVLDVKLRSSQVRAARTRMATAAFGVVFGTVLALYLAWRLGEVALRQFVYQNNSFAIRKIDVQTDGAIAIDQLRRWGGIKEGANLLALDIEGVKHDLELFPRIESASVERILPGTVRVRVSEREAVAQVKTPRVGSGRLEIVLYEIDAEGYVMSPLDARDAQNARLPGDSDIPLPEISGLNVNELLPGRRIGSMAAQAALQFIGAFQSSTMAALTDVRRIDISSPQVLVVTTTEGSEVTFRIGDFDEALRRWQQVHEECSRRNRVIATLDLAVEKNPPLRLQEGVAPPPPVQKTVKARNRRTAATHK